MEIYGIFLCLFLCAITRSCFALDKSNLTTEDPLHSSTNGNSSTQTAVPTTKTHSTTTSRPETDKCAVKTNCATCVENYKCYWCGPSKKCVTYPAHKITPRSCSKNDWYWKQCTVPGYVLIIVVPCLAVFILLTLGCCIYCKCCRTKSTNKEETRIKRRREEMKERNEERRRDRNNRTDQIRQKYGLLKSEDQEPLI